MDKAFIERYYRTYTSEDAEALRAFYADDVVMVSAAGETRGPEAILETYRYLISVFHDQMTPDKIEISGDIAVVDITDSFEANTEVEDFLGQQFKAGDSMTLKLRGTYLVVDKQFQHISIEFLA